MKIAKLNRVKWDQCTQRGSTTSAMYHTYSKSPKFAQSTQSRLCKLILCCYTRFQLKKKKQQKQTSAEVLPQITVPF